MTTYDLIDIYLFHYISTAHRKDLNGYGCCSMVEEMNNILTLYNSGANIKEVMEKCVCNRHGHQYCIPDNAVAKAVEELLNSKFCPDSLKKIPLINKKRKFTNEFKDFEELYDFVRSVIGGISGIGPLTIYDTARRIGHLLDTPIYPKEYVYLAAGAKSGAAALLARNEKSLKFREPTKIFHPFFGTLPSAFIEDMLCIFKDHLSSLPTAITTITTSAVKIFNTKINKVV